MADDDVPPGFAHKAGGATPAEPPSSGTAALADQLASSLATSAKVTHQ